jgi:hypothetical protein
MRTLHERVATPTLLNCFVKSTDCQCFATGKAWIPSTNGLANCSKHQTSNMNIQVVNQQPERLRSGWWPNAVDVTGTVAASATHWHKIQVVSNYPNRILVLAF